MPSLPEQFLAHLRSRKLLHAGERVAVGCSGGADSVALLRLLRDLRDELGIVLSVACFNHRLRGTEAEADAKFVAALAAKHRLELHTGSGDTAAYARASRLGLEEAARQLRYGFFASLLRGSVDQIATAHTLDDQAETVMMRLMRGAGTRGLAGILPQITVADESRAAAGKIIRPLLWVRRRELTAYLKSIRQSWREDSSNRDLRHTRNRVRRELLPLMESFNPEVARALADTAEIARGEEEYWSEQLAELAFTLRSPENGALSLAPLLRLPLAAQRRVIHSMAALAGVTLDFAHVERVRQAAQQKLSAHPRKVPLPGGGWAELCKTKTGKPELQFFPSPRRSSPRASRAGAPAAD